MMELQQRSERQAAQQTLVGDAGPRPVIANAAQKQRDKPDNERSGVLANSFLGLCRDPVVADVTRHCDQRVTASSEATCKRTLYLVAPSSDINRTGPPRNRVAAPWKAHMSIWDKYFMFIMII